MATEKTNFNNVVKNDRNATINNQKNPIVYDNGFDGTEEIRWQPEAFEATSKTTRINSATLSRKIYNRFKQVFHDLKGCNVGQFNGNIFVELFFEHNTEPLSDGKIVSLEPIANPKGTDLYARMKGLDNRKNGKLFTLNDETKLLLSSFMFGGRQNNNPKAKVWNNENVAKEFHIPAVNDPFLRAYNADRVMYRVTGLDIRRIIHELYGRDIVTKTIANEDVDTNIRSEARYEVRVAKLLANGTFMMNIEQFDSVAIEKMYAEENPMPQNFMGVQMYN